MKGVCTAVTAPDRSSGKSNLQPGGGGDAMAQVTATGPSLHVLYVDLLGWRCPLVEGAAGISDTRTEIHRRNVE